MTTITENSSDNIIRNVIVLGIIFLLLAIDLFIGGSVLFAIISALLIRAHYKPHARYDDDTYETAMSITLFVAVMSLAILWFFGMVAPIIAAGVVVVSSLISSIIVIRSWKRKLASK